jgi:spermidine/putrescine transport system permease protein
VAVEAQKIPGPEPARRSFLGRPRPGLATAGLITPPLLWLGIFFLVPVVLIFLYSVNVFSLYPGGQYFTLDAWRNFFDGSPFLDLFWKSVQMSLIVSVAAIVAAYPIAYLIALVASKRKYVLLLLIIAPFLVSYFLRLLSWKVILGDQGVVNTFFYWTGLRADGDPVSWLLYSQFAVILTLINVYVPFVALPIFVALESLDRRLLEAAADLGASRWQAFRRVTLPLSLPGVIAGFIFVFIPTIGEYFTPLIVGGVNGTMFGNAIADQFGQSLNWLNGAVLSFFLLAIVGVLMAIFARFLTIRRVATG